MQYDSRTNYHWAMSDPVLDRPDIERKFGMFTYNKVNKDFKNNRHYKKIFFLQGFWILNIKLSILIFYRVAALYA
jgi:hypothetical protein